MSAEHPFKRGRGIWLNGRVWRIVKSEDHEGSLCLTVERRFQHSRDGGLLGSITRLTTYVFPEIDSGVALVGNTFDPATPDSRDCV